MPDPTLDVGAWLAGLGLDQYAAAFAANDIEADLLPDLTNEDLKELGVTSLGHRKRLLAAVSALQQTAVSPTAAAPTLPPELYTPGHLADRILQSRGALEGEIKQVTILFVDIQRSTELVSTLSAEEASRRLYPVLRQMMAAVHRYEGTVNKLQGDGLMAIFGAPLALEDHAVRACYAALAMRRDILADQQAAPHDPIEIRIGLHSGEVVVRAIENDLSMAYDAIGITVHLAARMEQSADANAIRLTAETARLADGFIDVAPLGPVQVKGIAEPVEVYDLRGATSVRTRWQSSLTRGLRPFVGREAEMAALVAALDAAAAGQGGLVTISGDAGIGKSRLTHEFARRAAAQGWRVLAAGSVSYGQATTWLPIIDLLRDYFEFNDNDDTATMVAKARDTLDDLDPALSEDLPALLALFDIDLQSSGWNELGTLQRRRRALNALQALFIAESRRRPLLLIVEDLHWIDSQTQTLLDELAPRLAGQQLLLLVNFRPYYENPWSDEDAAMLRLEPLARDNISALLDSLMGDDPDLDDLKAALLLRAEGSPLFVEESVRALAETAGLRGRAGAYRLGDAAAAVGLPETIQAIIAGRIDRLSPEHKRLLQTASVAGTTVPLSLLQSVTDLSAESLEEGLNALQTAEFLYETQLFPEKEVAFTHSHIHQVAYEGLLYARRTALHARIGAAMRALYPDRRRELAEKLAGHFEQGEVWDQAIEAYLLAAEKAKDKYDYAAAAAYARKAPALAAASGESFAREQAQALALLGDLAGLRDDLEGANAAYEQALALATDKAQRQHIANRMHRRHFAERAGSRIAYYSHGRGAQTLVLAAPLGYVQSLIQPVVERLCQEFRVITYDNLGLGASDPLPQDYRFRDQVEDLRAVIEDLDSGPVVLMGLSQSAAAAVRLAHMYPHLLSQLILVGMSVGLPRTTRPVSPEARAYFRAIRSGDFSGHAQYMEQFIAERIPEPESRDVAADFAARTMRMPHDVWLNFTAPDKDKDVSDLLPLIDIPTLLMYGTEDHTLTYDETAEFAMQRLPNAQLYLFEGKGHLPLFTAQKEFCDVVRRLMLTGSVAGAEQ